MWEDLFDAAESRDEKAAILAAEILTLSRNLLLVNFRFLDRAIANIRFVQHPDVTFATDGRNIYYSPWFVLSMYRTEQTSVVRSMLHSMLHCVFRHNFIGEDIDRSAWNLAADVAVENAINELNTETVRVNRQKDQELLVKKLRSEVPVMTAERIFHYLIRNEYSDGVMDKERVPFVGDDHAGWYSKGAGQVDIEADIDLEELWEEISKRMQTELEVVMGNEDALTQNLRDINRTRYDYTEFLRHFGVHGEVMHLSDEEFDINESGKRRVYTAVGNCLIGDMNNTRESMAAAWMNGSNAATMIGYVVTTWHGRAGWGALKYWVTSPDRYTLAEAVFMNEQDLLHQHSVWTPELLNESYNYCDKYIEELTCAAQTVGESLGREVDLDNPTDWDMVGFWHDRDVLVYYGDPKWDVKLQSVENERDYTITTATQGNKYIITITTAENFSLERMRGDKFKQEHVLDLPFNYFFPERLRNPRLSEGETWDAVVDENFILVYNADFEPNSTYTITLEIN